MNNDTLATELLHELKASAKRWFIAFCVMVTLEVFTIVGFMWYLSLPTDTETMTQTVEGIDSSDIKQVGGDYNGESNTDSEENTQSNTE